MNESFYIFSNALTVFVFFDFMTAFLGKFKVNYKLIFCGYAGFYILSTSFYSLFNNPILLLIANVSVLILVSLLYDAKMSKRLLTVFTVFAASIFWNGVLLNLSTLINPQIPLIISSGLGTAIMLYFTETILKKIFVKSNDNLTEIKTKHYIPLLLPIASIVVGYFTTIQWNTVSIITAFFLLINNIIIFHLYDDILQSYSKHYNQKLLENTVGYYKNELKSLQNSQSKIQFLQHDMKNHLLAVRSLAENKDMSAVIDYIDKSAEYILPLNFSSTGNVFTDSIINYKFGEAASQGIICSVSTKISEEIMIEPFDLSVILGNLIDNAINAASQTENKKIHLELLQNRDVLIITISNTFTEKNLKTEKPSTSEKLDKIPHGLGLKSVKFILDKYGGVLKNNIEDDIFTAKAILYLP
jgi:signal transduction histidine kinase